MAQAPVMPIYTDALIGDTEHLTTEQFGAYFKILIVTWRNNGVALPDDDKRMARICKVTIQRWKSSIRPVISEFFSIDSTGWHQKRLQKEWQKLLRKKSNGSKGGTAKALKYNKTTPSKPPSKRLVSISIKKEEEESLCFDSKTPSRAHVHTHARTRARKHKNHELNQLNGGGDWHDQYIDIGRKAAGL